MSAYTKLTAGSCLPGWSQCEVTLDPDAPILSGDVVRMTVDYPDGQRLDVLKEVRYSTVAQKWYACALDAHGTERAIALPNLLRPALCHKVISRRPAPVDVHAPPCAKPPSEATLELYDDSSKRARAEWTAHGWLNGAVLDVASILAPEVALTATLPESSVQQPGTPTDFEIETIGSTIQFWWTEPEVWPLGSKYQLYAAATSLSDVASKELIWEGSDQGKSLTFSATSQWYFQIRAQHGSYHSAFSPNTYGIPALPQLAEPWSSGMWLFSVSPGFVAKLSSESVLTTAAITGVLVNTAGTAIFSWTNPSSINIRINSPGAASTTFTGSGMSVEEVRQGYFFVNVSDAGNISSKSAHVYIERWSGDS